MPSVKGILKSAYYIPKLLFSLLWALVYFRWSIWRAKRSFAEELTEQGIPKDIARELANMYDKQNKRLLNDLISAARSAKI